ncbi:hypothetical protein HAX54_028072, partial [Datura stramonium]|nr:hypothetical protein [Datura stramonium]
ETWFLGSGLKPQTRTYASACVSQGLTGDSQAEERKSDWVVRRQFLLVEIWEGGIMGKWGIGKVERVVGEMKWFPPVFHWWVTVYTSTPRFTGLSWYQTGGSRIIIDILP